MRFSADVQDGASYEGDLTWSVEALENILKNCMEHTPAGGCVSVRVTEDVLACRIRIEDTGPGIAESDLPHIFERFYRGSRDANAASSEVNPAGVGIGLALSKSLVTAQGGTLTAEYSSATRTETSLEQLSTWCSSKPLCSSNGGRGYIP